MLELKKIEKSIESMDIFDLLSNLKELSIIQRYEELVENDKIMVEGLIERIQERIVLKWYS